MPPDQFFHDAPIPVFPISWQDTGSGVFTRDLIWQSAIENGIRQAVIAAAALVDDLRITIRGWLATGGALVQLMQLKNP
jgi:hypothetical protein